MKKSQLAYAIWPWGTETREEAILAAKEISEIGFTQFESVRQALYAYNFDLEAYKSMLDSYGLKPTSFYFSFRQMEDEKEYFDKAAHDLEFIAKLGAKRATLQGSWGRPEGGVMDDASRQRELDLTVKFAKLTKEFGLETNLHPHINTYHMYEDETDFLMQNTDPDLVHFAPDTAHIAAAGGDPVELIRKYKDRVNFIHLKDYTLGTEITTRGWVDSGVPIMDCFHGLGLGAVDFAEVIKILDSVNYTGPLCIELDNPPISNVDSAKKSYEYIKQFLED